MKDYNAKIVEEFGFKASKKGFFMEWQEMTSSVHKKNNISYDKAAELAYYKLKLLGSE
jgi:hypothetical protein